MRSKLNPFTCLTFPYIGWITALIVIPMFLILFYAFTVEGNDVVAFKFSFDNFVRFFSTEEYVDATIRSLLIAFTTTITCILVGYPIAYIISKAKGNHSMILILLLTMPTWINMLVRTYAWIGILQEGGLLLSVLNSIGINIDSTSENYATFKVTLGMVYNFLPFMVLQIHTALAKMDNSLIEAAADLGANKVQSFLKVTLPLSLPGVISGVTLVFLPAVSSFFIPYMLGGPQYVLVGNIIESQYLTSGDWHFGSAISCIMAIVIIISMWLTRKLDVQPQKEN